MQPGSGIQREAVFAGSPPFSGQWPAGVWSACPEVLAELRHELSVLVPPPSPVVENHSLGIYLDASSSFLDY